MADLNAQAFGVSSQNLRERAFARGFEWTERMNRRFAQGHKPFFERHEFPWVHKVEARWSAICEELARVGKTREALPNFQDISPEQASITQDDKWKIFPFLAYAQRFEPNIKKCPETWAALQLIPGLRTAMFSVLHGPKNIPEHRGPFNGVLRYHLALRIPGDPSKCRIRVGQEWRTWREGESLIFDDSFPHEVINENPGERVVLFVDFLRPAPKPLAWVNRKLVDFIGSTPFIQNGMANMNRWQADFDLKQMNKMDEEPPRNASPVRKSVRPSAPPPPV